MTVVRQFSLVDCISRGPPIRTKLDRTRVDCATSNVNANIRGRSRTTAHVSGGLNISGQQGRRGNFSRNAPATVRHRAEAANVGSRLEFGVHWRRLDAEAHLGYRKGKRSGVWFVRWRNHHDGANYKQAPVGVANDVNDKPAEGTLTFEQAVTQAREHATRSRTEAAAQAAGPAPTVRTAVETYIRERNARDSRRAGREVRSDVGHRLRRYVLGQEERGS